ncbi:MAG: hypothetical protein M0R73_13720 [Dehalococcoidia bacterium]|nr:hypothetical protein [Dehalococcoidia bacterium]
MTLSPPVRGTSRRRALLLASTASLIAGAVYLVIAFGVTADDFESPPRPVMLVAGLIYLVGAGVLHLVDRRLLLVGAVANAVVLVLFGLSAARGTGTVDTLSLGGKAAQVALSVLLLWIWSGTSSRIDAAREGPSGELRRD